MVFVSPRNVQFPSIKLVFFSAIVLFLL
jgi:hypothetical protein